MYQRNAVQKQFAGAIDLTKVAQDIQLSRDRGTAETLVSNYKWMIQNSPRRKAILSERVVSPDRLEATALLAANALRRRLKGDFVETGVFRGLSSVLMMLAMQNQTRAPSGRMWACDSFEGLPATDATDEHNEANCSRRVEGGQRCMVARGRTFLGSFHASERTFMKNVISLVAPAFWQQRLSIVKGWFNETLPAPGMSAISFLRLDGDLYTSTRDTLAALYPLLSNGSLIYVDDYGSFGGCGKAVDDYLAKRGCQETPQPVYERSAAAGGWAHVSIASHDMQTRLAAGRTFEAVWWMKIDCR